MKFKKSKFSNIVFLLLVVLLIVPQTRQPIQVLIHKALAMISPSQVSEEDRETLTDYNWQLQSLEGLDYDFKQAEGKVVLINIWATWCPPCIAEMPALQSLYNDYEDKIEFLLISQEETKVITQFLNKHEYTFKTYRPLSDTPETLQTRSIPRTFIINKKGEIVIDKTGAANWNSKEIRNTIDGLIAE